MSAISRGPGVLFLLAMLTMPVPGSLSAQELDPSTSDITVVGTPPADLSGMPEGPEIEGFIAARSGNKMEVTGADGADTVIFISDGTEIRSSGGFLGLNRSKLAADSLLNGLPVTVKTVQWDSGLVASEIKFKNNDLKTASMIRSGTARRFDQQDAAIDENAAAIDKNAAATEALRGRLRKAKASA